MITTRTPWSRRAFMKTTAAAAAGAIACSSESASADPVRPSDLTMFSLAKASASVRRRKVSPVELTTACLERIDRLNPRLGAFITIARETALSRARAAEQDIQRRGWRGPLHGIPIALEDLFDTAGTRTTAANMLLEQRIPERDAEVVRRLDAAGAVIIGKTNMVEFAYGSNAAISAFGPARNPWRLDRNPGGSSSWAANQRTAFRRCDRAAGCRSVRTPIGRCTAAAVARLMLLSVRND